MTEANPTPSTGAPVAPSGLNYATAPAVGYFGPAPTADEKNMAMLTYLLAIFTGFLGPLIIWLVKKDQSPFIADQGKEVLNFEITRFIAILCCIPLMFVLIGFLLFPVIIIASVILLVIGLLKAKDGIPYRFPFALRLLK